MDEKRKKSADNRQKKKEGKMAKLFQDSKIKRFLDDIFDGEINQFDVTTLNGFMKELFTRIRIIDITGLASQLAFFFLLSLFPLLLFTFTLLPYLNLDQAEIFMYIRDYAPENVANLMEETLFELLNNRSGGLLSFSIIGTIWSASKGMNALTKALNLSYLQEESRSFIIARGMSIVFTIMLIGVLVVALILPVFGKQIGTFVFSYLGLADGFLNLWSSLRWILPPIFIYSVFSLIFWLVPNVKLPYSSVVLGSIVATIGWIITSLGFSFYVGNYANYSSTYGSIGTIIVLMMWLYLSGIILMVSGQINAVMRERKQIIFAKEKSNAIV